ncbi:hypothetical protein [Helicobacter sp.]|uniref:hypothetical protein n=1 Tax=Helicobacter sp. TaxID=218 RepID=UPI0019968714|nr:hypothetical protein [Helicobacter sp.]MBD5165570.1 hypothetical protein [Helicobacter sp.]
MRFYNCAQKIRILASFYPSIIARFYAIESQQSIILQVFNFTTSVVARMRGIRGNP